MTNPRNPYNHQVAYDEHVWLPRAGAGYMSLDAVDAEYETVLEWAYRLFPEVLLVNHIREHKLVVQADLIRRLDDNDVQKIRAKCSELSISALPLNLLRIGTHFFPDVAKKLNTISANPPDHVHRIQKGDRYYIGDIYSANMIASSLDRSGLGFEAGARYLDFGCSSGSLIRMLQAYRPSARFHGVDPIKEAVEWAAAEVRGSTFAVSQQNPPLDCADGSFDGAMAVSIWSHFGEREALAWFDEVHRCLKPGGWLFFTTHGLLSVYRHCFLRIHPPERVKALFEGLLNSDYVFEEKYVGQSPEGLDVQGWGNAYILRSWVVRNLAAKWDLLAFEPAANQSNQDIYVLRRR